MYYHPNLTNINSLNRIRILLTASNLSCSWTIFRLAERLKMLCFIFAIINLLN